MFLPRILEEVRGSGRRGSAPRSRNWFVLLFPLFLFFFLKDKIYSSFSFLLFLNIDTGFADSEPVIPVGIVRPIQIADLHPERKAASPSVSASGDTVMGDASKVAASDLDLRLSSFLAQIGRASCRERV